MANGGEVVFEFKGNTKDIQKAYEDVQSGAKKAASSFEDTISSALSSTNLLKSGISMATTAISGAFNIATDSLNKLGDGLLDLSDNSISKATSALSGLGAVGVAAFAGIATGVKNATKRYDTLKNFPKIMKNFGIGATESKEAISELEKAIDGLPTALDDAASGTARLVAKNSDVKKSTKYFKAMNDAIVAGNAPAEQQRSAIEQLTQAYSKGKPDMMEWRTLMMAMPGQLNQVAKAMGKVDATQLGEDLRSGKVSMDEFMDTLVRLDTEGVGDFLSFQDQVHNAVDSIGTAMTNFGNRVNKGFAEVLGGIDTAFENSQFKSLAGIINQISTNVKNALTKIGTAIKDNKVVQDFAIDIAHMTEAMTDFVNSVSPQTIDNIVSTVTALIRNLPLIGAAIGGLNLSKGFIGTLGTGLTGIQSFADGITDYKLSVVSNVPIVGQALGGLGASIEKFRTSVAINALKMLTAVGGFSVAFGTLGLVLGQMNIDSENAIYRFAKTFSEKAPEVIKTFVQNIVKQLPAIIQNGSNIMGALLTGIINALPYVIAGISEVINALIQITNNNADLIGQLLVTIMVGLATIILNNLPLIVETAMKILTAVINYLSENADTLIPVIVDCVILIAKTLIDNLPTIILAAGRLINALKQALKDYAPTAMKNAATTIGTSLLNNISNAFSNIWSIGANLVKGLWSGINDKIGWVVSKIRGMGSSIINAIKGIFGVHSPSVEFAYIGKMNMLGLEEGMENEQKKVQSQIDGMFNLEPNISQTMQVAEPRQDLQSAMQNMILNLQDRPISLDIRADEGIIVKKATEGFKDYVRKTGTLPFPVMV